MTTQLTAAYTVWHEMVAGSNFRQFRGFSNDPRKLDVTYLVSGVVFASPKAHKEKQTQYLTQGKSVLFVFFENITVRTYFVNSHTLS